MIVTKDMEGKSVIKDSMRFPVKILFVGLDGFYGCFTNSNGEYEEVTLLSKGDWKLVEDPKSQVMPSDRIHMIIGAIRDDSDYAERNIRAILQYLDEQFDAGVSK